MKNKIIGFLGIFIIGFMSLEIANLISIYVKFEALTVGIILGIAFKYVIGDLSKYDEPINFSAKKLLKIGIVLLGFKVNFNTLLQLGLPAILGVAGFVTLILFLAKKIGSLLGVKSKLALLVGVGSSICGASAIVTMAPVINADEDDAILAVSIVSFLGTIGVLIYSAIALLPLMTDFQYGIYSGLTLHGVGHALAAAFARGDYAGEIGTIIKMTRVLFLVPLALILGQKYGNHSEKKKVHFPIYVLLFILMAVINSTGIVPYTISKLLGKLSSYAILASMIAMGLKVNFANVKKSGVKTTQLGVMLFLVSSFLVFTLLMIFL